MKRIIFVDDEPEILYGLKNLLRKYRADMEIVFVPGAEAALKELERAPAEVLVTDMRMPGMDGEMLLAKVKEEHPATVRIILSGHAERDGVLPAMRSAHQILSKPCDAEKLRSVILRAWRMHELLSDPSMRACLGRIESLPSLPQAYWELMGVLSDTNFSVRRITEILEADSAMCSKLLQIANSPCFCVASDITSVERAE